MSKALVLAGHGSARNPNTRKPLCGIVREIKKRGLYDEVRCGLLKEEPRICHTLDPVKSERITVVPFFISEGYYTATVIPKCLGLEDPDRYPGRRILYTSPVGAHPRFADLILQHAQAAGWQSGDALMVLGHGTPKNPTSGRNVFLQADRIRKKIPGEEILTAFIDEAPFVTRAWELCRAERIVIVPLFVADGWHVSETIPEDLGLEDGFARRGNRCLRMTAAVGTDPGLVEVVLALAAEAESAAG